MYIYVYINRAWDLFADAKADYAAAMQARPCACMLAIMKCILIIIYITYYQEKIALLLYNYHHIFYIFHSVHSTRFKL